MHHFNYVSIKAGFAPTTKAGFIAAIKCNLDQQTPLCRSPKFTLKRALHNLYSSHTHQQKQQSRRFYNRASIYQLTFPETASSHTPQRGKSIVAPKSGQISEGVRP